MEQCGNINQAFTCIRKKGHNGDHKAYGAKNKFVYEWLNEDD